MRNPPLPIEQRLRVAFDLHDFGVKIMRQNLKRGHPHASESEIDGLLEKWMRERPLDAPGTPSQRFERA